ncbi:MAG: phosphatidylinositol mannoside acyltransferase [Actinobacteria bacterium]|uniref:Unannotated protein n=1 Tax=freshwater metagenome TaxID=449393 RepID=A0A6J6R7U9_9ZZZZ|nr:phosphatidylinositol mannoside acyltransferase [Actinomycetota bacterium]MSY82116.1 phosphatidylinositol mannoside acyltransferase [Actinomycetota bacterium]MSZ45782.1 phosphatidylinositol mannoside acyltransferase [Actinomycetota bacterium]MTA04752.1 phosphatidylinositol mannoside acyltransferase [Actinomycetota bacterium]
MKHIAYLGYSLGWKLVRLLPETSAYRIAYFAADYLTKKNGKGVQRLRKNYARIRPELSVAQLEELVQLGMRSYLRYWIDTFRFPTWSRERTISSVTVTGEELLRDPLANGTGVIVSLPHAGNWDHAGAYFCFTGAPLVTVAEHLEPEKLFQKFLEYRHSIGMEVLDLNSRAIAVLAQRARAGKLIALVADRDLSSSGVPVNFFGYPSRMPAGPALLAVQTGAHLITAFVSYTQSGIHIDFKGPISVPPLGTATEKVALMTQQAADNFASGLREHTQDWHMLQRIWVDEDFKERS